MSERSEAKRDGAKQQKNSGRGDYQKGDALWDIFVVDYKESLKSIAVSEDMWSKICTDTFRVDRSRHPLLKLILGDKNKVRLAVLEWSMLEDLVRNNKDV